MVTASAPRFRSGHPPVTGSGVCSTAKVDMVRALGTDQVIDYSREDFADGQHRYDVILDIGGNRRLSHLRRASPLREDSSSSEARPMVGGGAAPTDNCGRSCCPSSSARNWARSSHQRTPPTDRFDPGHRDRPGQAGHRPVLSPQRRRHSHPRPHRRPRPRQDRHHHVNADHSAARLIDFASSSTPARRAGDSASACMAVGLACLARDYGRAGEDRRGPEASYEEPNTE
jgi:hypothetical protein